MLRMASVHVSRAFHLFANQNLEENMAYLRSRYGGSLRIASDLLYVTVE
jgi:hypothetical protein